jgi:hypothetical protein
MGLGLVRCGPKLAQLGLILSSPIACLLDAAEGFCIPAHKRPLEMRLSRD